MSFLNNLPTTTLWIIGGIFLFILFFLWFVYNAFVTKRNEVKAAFANIDVQLKRRASLIENLVALVREYAKHESRTFENVAKARSALVEPHGPRQTADIDNMLSQTLKSLLAVAENYPKLQASDNYQRLQNDLKETEDMIAGHREAYNQAVLDFNTMIQTFPNLLAASLFGFGEEELFQSPETDTQDVEITTA
ncbi:MAG: LemA family protein [Candidatus Daviesbacteria bacterium]